MAPSKSLSLAEQIAHLSNPAPEEFDPESVQDPYASDPEDDSDDGSDLDENAGREHYVEVGKSKLRQNQDVHLHPKYNGAAVSRDNLYDDSEDEEIEDDNDDDEEIDSGSDSDDGGVKLSIPHISNVPKERKSANAKPTEDIDEAMEGLDSDEDMDDDDDEEYDEDEKEDDDEDSGDSDEGELEKSRRAELRSLMAVEQKNMAEGLSQAAKADAQKGLAVRNQRAFFDTCLKSRMQIKNALISVNSLPEEPLDATDKTVRAAEDAALALWNTISSLRHELIRSRGPENSKKSSNKRKHEDITKDSDSESIWKSMQQMEAENAMYRNSILEKWSSKVQAAANVIPSAKKLNQSASVQTVSSQLRDQLSNVSIEVAKSRVPQESAPLQKAQKIEEDSRIYDDTDFYKRLLLILLEQRGNNITNGGVIQLAPTDLQELKVKKHRANVDTKASKGRKLRYHVHDKLQNFMMPDDTLEWQEQQIDEFFSSLLGQRRRVLDEQSDDEDEDRGVVQVSQLFRSTVVS